MNDSVYKLIKLLRGEGAIYVKAEGVEVKFSPHPKAGASRQEQAESVPVQDKEDGFNFFFSKFFGQESQIEMSESEAAYVRELLADEGAAIIERLLRQVRYGA